MQSLFTEYLSSHQWKQIKPMTFKNAKYACYELFFDTSNQVELYFKNKRIDEKYLANLEDLKKFLIKNSFKL